MRAWVVIAGLSGGMAVAMGAYAAHGLSGNPQAAVLVEQAVRYQIYHALALLGAVLLAERGARLARFAAAAFTLGSLLFCGSLYAIGLVEARPGPLAPLGGSLLILGWMLLAAAGLSSPKKWD